MTGYVFDAVIFDFDGVIVESVDVKTRAFAALYAPYGPEVVARVVAYHLDHGGISRFEKFRHFHREFLGTPLSIEEETSLGVRFSALVEDAVVASPWVPGAREFLECYHREISLFVASGTPDTELKRIIAGRFMADYFVAVHGAPATKSKIIARILRERKFQAQRVLMVGDSKADYEGANSTGVRFLARVRSDSGSFPAAVRAIHDLKELPHFLSCWS